MNATDPTSEALAKIRGLFNEAIQNGVTDPRDIAAKADVDLTDEDRDAAWIYLLGLYATKMAGNTRRTVGPPVPRTVDIRGTRFASPRQARQFNWWTVQLQVPHALAPGVWKAFGDLSLKEVETLAGLRRKEAAEAIAVSQRYDRLAAEMRRINAARVGDVDEAPARRVWGAAA